jgi:large subunit ribosomal protein L6
MSRIGLKPIQIPKDVEVEIKDGEIVVKGPLGELKRKLREGIVVERENGVLKVKRLSDDKFYRSLHGLSRTLIANMIEGVSKGFEKVLEIYGTGYRAQIQGNKLVLNLGFSHPVNIEVPPDLKVTVEGQNIIKISGIDKEKVGQFSAYVRKIKKVEPYKGKGIRYRGEVFRKKAGKAGKIGSGK